MKYAIKYDEKVKEEKVHKDFLTFVKSMWPDFIQGSHHKKIADQFNRLAEGKINRLIINMPPRHTKSEFASFLLPIPEYRFPERAASALAVLAQRAEFLRRATQPSQVCCAGAKEKAETILRAYLASDPKPGDFLPADILEVILSAYGLRTPATSLATSPHQAVEMAAQIGFPVALKIASPDIPHKSDVDGVLLNLHDQAAVVHGFSQVVENARLARPQAHIQGVHIQRMTSGGQDVIIGAVQDQQFGALVMFGSGGTEVEGLHDIGFALAPITEEEGEFLLESTWAGRKLKGYRNQPPADRKVAMSVITADAEEHRRRKDGSRSRAQSGDK